MATQIKSKLSSVPPGTQGADKNHALNNGHQHSNESVDLDNLFAFLSEVTPSPSNNNVIDDISENLNTLAQDLDVELENVIQQEIDGLTIHDKPTGKPQLPPIIGVPTLPEPTMPPPPPPVLVNNLNGNNNVVDRMPPVCDLPPPLAKQVKPTRRSTAGDDEPIYEAVIPRDDVQPKQEIIVEIPPHHGGMDHKMR